MDCKLIGDTFLIHDALYQHLSKDIDNALAESDINHLSSINMFSYLSVKSIYALQTAI
jgi:hypothetical protein